MVNGDVQFDTKFRLDLDPNKPVEIYDTIDYAGLGENINDFVGVVKVSGPTGTIYENTDFDNPDIVPGTSRQMTTLINLILDATDEYQVMKGQYTVKYSVKDTVSQNTYENTLVYGFHFDVPTMDVDVDSGVYSAKLRSWDNTDYGSDIELLTREHRIHYPEGILPSPPADIVSTLAFIEVDPIYTNLWVITVTSTVDYKQAADDLEYRWAGSMQVNHCVMGACINSLYDDIDTMYTRYLAYLPVNRVQADIYRERLIQVNTAWSLLDIAWREDNVAEADKQAAIIQEAVEASDIYTCSQGGTSVEVTPCGAWGGGGITPPTYTFENGITEAAGVVKLGGALTGATTINLSSYALVVQDTQGSDSVLFQLDAGDDIVLSRDDSATKGAVEIAETGVLLKYQDIGTPANTRSYKVGSGGLVENADYRSSYTARSLICKEYADSIASCAFGSEDQIPRMNAGGTDFEYDDNFKWNDRTLVINDSLNNVFIGVDVGSTITTGHSNVAVGYQASKANNSGLGSVAIGFQSQIDNLTNGNTTIGYQTLFASTSNAKFCVAVGYGAGHDATGDYSVFLGRYAGYNSTGDYKLYIESSNSSTPLIYGEFDNDKLIFNCAVDLAQLQNQPTGGTDLAIATTKYVDDNAGATTLIALTDFPNSYAGQGGKVVAVKAAVDGVEFIPANWVASTGGVFTGQVIFEETNDYSIILRQTNDGGSPGTPEAGINRIGFQDMDGDLQGYVGIDNNGDMALATNITGGIVHAQNDMKVTGDITVTGLAGSYFFLESDTTGKIQKQAILQRSGSYIYVLGSMQLADQKPLYFGSANDARIYHSGTIFYIEGYTHGDPVWIRAENTSGDMKSLIYMDPDNVVNIYYAGDLRFSTSVAGVTVTGTIQATGTGISNFAGVISGQTPTLDSHLATKAYVDANVSGLQIKEPCRVATVGNIVIATALNDGDTIDDITLSTGDRVFVKNQSAPEQNGIYVVGVSPARATDADDWDELVMAYAWIDEGTVNASSSWVCVIIPGGTLETTAIPVEKFASPTAYAAGDGLALAGNIFSVDLAVSNPGLQFTSGDLQVIFAGTGSTYNAAHSNHTHSTPLEDLSDVTISAVASGELIQWSGSAWINQTFAELAIATTTWVTANFNDYTHPNHTGHVTSTGEGATVLVVASITGQPALTTGLVSTDELLVNDGGAIKRMDISVIATYMKANITPGDIGAAPASHEHVEADITDLGNYAVVGHEHSAANITSGILPVVRGGTGLATVGSDRILTGNSTGALTAEATLTYNSSQMLSVGGVIKNSGVFNTTEPDGASAVGFIFNTPAYSTAGATLFSIQNNSASKFSIDYSGNALFVGYVIANAGLGIGIIDPTKELAVYGNTSGEYVGLFTQDHVSGHGLRIDVDGASSTVLALSVYSVSTKKAEIRADGDMWARNFLLSSDAILKKNVVGVKDGLNIALALRPVHYDWKDERDEFDHIGFIAQDLEEVRPELVKDGDHKSIAYSTITAINNAAIHVLNNKFESNEDKIKRLEKRIKELEENAGT